MAADHPYEIRFHSLVNRWFADRIGRPTRIQARAWPLIADDSNVLIMAPTGSGKTLAAFLWALDQLICGRWETGQTRVLYVSPLKALNNDVQRNLIRPLTEIRLLFEGEDRPFPAIRVATRSGDTPSSQRRQMIRRPPEILITTPESLHLMTASQGGRSMLGRIRTVILDEIHAVVGGKRGTLLMSAVDRLVPLCGEFQRIALSATVKPEDTVAAFVGGYRMEGDTQEPIYVPRSVKRCRCGHQRQETIEVCLADTILSNQDGRSVWDDLADRFRETIRRNRSTIIFVNSRRLCEKLTFLINSDPRPSNGADRGPDSGADDRIAGRDPIAYAHHGSLSKELRLEVEQRLKKGQLRAIVATASLELGIDIGFLDHVILVQSPPSISSAVQRIGRSGHGVGEVSRASFFPSHATDSITAAVLAEAVTDKDIEPVRPVECPLDVLAQVVVAMVGLAVWDARDLYNSVRTSYPFRDLKRRIFDLVVEMLAGRYAATRIPALQPKIAFDRLDNTLTARKGALLTLYTSGGVIPDRGYFGLRHQESGARIGELDEEFVWEAKKGQVFTLGTQNWRIHRITHNDVFVRPASPKAPAPPFWRAEDADRDFYLSEKIARFLETAQSQIPDSGFLTQLQSRHHMDANGSRYLVDFLRRQQKKTGCALPHRHHVVVERLPAGKGADAHCQMVIHTFWGGRVNRPFALALEAAWEKRHGHAPSIFPDNDVLYLMLPRHPDGDEIMTLVSSGNVEALLRERLEGSGVFGARFRECAARALLLPRRHFNQRMPLWLTRQKSQRLLDALGRYTDFPILLETWRTCLQDDFDMPALVRVLEELEGGAIAWTQVSTASPSPMALSGSWRLINQYMYADDRQPGKVKTDLAPDLLEEVVFSPQLRPLVKPEIVAAFEQKRQRLHPGYAPDTPIELLEWVKERLLLPIAEWQRLIQRAVIDSGRSSDVLLDPIREKLARLSVDPSASDADGHLIVALEMMPAIAGGLYADRADIHWESLAGTSHEPFKIPAVQADDTVPDAPQIVAQWLRFYGPISAEFIGQGLALDDETVAGILAELVETRAIICGSLIRGRKSQQYCDANNFDTLLRISRRRGTPAIEPRDIEKLSLALAQFQGLTLPGDNVEALAACLAQFMGLPLPASLWEKEILPARLVDYDPQWLDRLMQESALVWLGRPGQRLFLCHETDLDLITDRLEGDPATDDGAREPVDEVMGLFPDRRGSYRLSALLGDPPRPPHQVRELLWEGLWAGRVTTDNMATLRQGIATGGKAGGRGPDPIGHVRGAMARRRSRRLRGARRPVVETLGGAMGNWRLVDPPPPPQGLMDTEELVKDRVRLLLDRYGILFRQLLKKELSMFRWPAIFRSLRLMELSGEILAGCFFNGIPGLQFISRPMLRHLKGELPEDRLYWISAQDPASLCGLGLDGLKGHLPRRVAGTHLVYLGSRLAMVAQRNGRVLQIHLPVDHERLGEVFDLFDHLLTRRVDPVNSISVETINDQAAAASPYLDLLSQRFDIVTEIDTITVYRRM